MQEKKYRVLNRMPEPGDLVRLKTDGFYMNVKAGEVYPVSRVKTYDNGNTGVFIAGESLPAGFNDNYEYIFHYPDECETVVKLPVNPPGYDPDDVKLTHPAEPDEDDESGCTPEEVCSLPVVEILYMLRDSLQEVTFTADGDIIAKFK